ncbi:hypothetical protein GCM10009122_49150 [Fulvivirga kasyanovii]|uniref:hypothetical protein n=1 Tax=Fulvivirga kasyanovii TaxID=396812 RepID=UPI001628E07C|nr:hypothetical protein [Fulvivirga kasyanovii]
MIFSVIKISMVKRGKAYATKTGAAINVQVARYFGEFAAYDDKKTGRDLYMYAEILTVLLNSLFF